MTTRLLFPAIVSLFSVLIQTQLYAETHDRYVRFVVDESQLVQIQSGGVSGVELFTGFSQTFKPAQLTGVDMLNVHAQFFDQQGNQLYIVLRDLGGEFLNERGRQWFQVAAGLDIGTVSGTYVNGWVFTDSVPRRPGNFACCTKTANSQSVIESVGYGFDVTDSTIAIESMRFQFNFNHYSNPVVITDGGGFNRLSLRIRSEDIALAQKPIAGQIQGPWADDGTVIDIDGNGRGSLGSITDQKIAVGYGAAQHFRYPVIVFPSRPNTSELAYPIFLPDGFVFDAIGEQNFDGCSDGNCDGLSNNANPDCLATISGPVARRKQIEPRAALLELSSTFSGAFCNYYVHIVTEAETKGRKTDHWPSVCLFALDSSSSPVYALFRATNGVQILDRATDTLLPETLTGELEPVGCE